MANVPRARLGEYREQSGAISFRITSSPEFSATIAELKRRVPGWARQYNARTSEWRVKSEFRDVLEELFLNVPSLYGSSTGKGGFEEEGPRSEWLWVALIGVIVVTVGALLWAQRGNVSEETAAPAAESAAVAAQPAEAAFAPQSGRVTSVVNLRGGPGTSFDVQSKLNAGAPVTIVARAMGEDGYWWLQVEGGSWVRSDLVVSTAAGELPLDLRLLPDAAIATAADAQTAAPAMTADERIAATVTWVSDGETIHVQIAGREYRVRYIGIDAPDRGDAHYQAATDANGALVAGKTVLLAKDVSDTDSLGRLLRYVYLPDGAFVNEALVRDGWAAATTVEPDVAQASVLYAAEQAARNKGSGIWALQ